MFAIAAAGNAVAAGVERDSAGGVRTASEQDPARAQDPAGHPLSVPMN